MITLIEKGHAPIMQGNTTLDDDKTLQIGEKKGIDICCPECSSPFILSLQLFGIINDTVVCHICKKEICFIVERDQIAM